MRRIGSRTILIQVVLGAEGAHAIDVEGGDREAEQDGHLHSPKHPEETSSQVDK